MICQFYSIANKLGSTFHILHGHLTFTIPPPGIPVNAANICYDSLSCYYYYYCLLKLFLSLNNSVMEWWLIDQLARALQVVFFVVVAVVCSFYKFSMSLSSVIPTPSFMCVHAAFMHISVQVCVIHMCASVCVCSICAHQCQCACVFINLSLSLSR